MLKEPLWLAGLSVNALLAILAERPKEFIYVDRYTVVEVPCASSGTLLQAPTLANSERKQFEFGQSNYKPQEKVGNAMQYGERTKVWEPQLRTPMSGGKVLQELIVENSERELLFEGGQSNYNHRGRKKVCEPNLRTRTKPATPVPDWTLVGRGKNKKHKTRAAQWELADKARQASAKIWVQQQLQQQEDERRAMAARRLQCWFRAWNRKQLGRAAEHGEEPCEEDAARGDNDGLPGVRKSRNKKKRKAQQEAEENDALDRAILEAQRADAEEQQIVRELLADRRQGPCGHELQVAPKWMKGAAACACCCCGITNVSFCCRDMGSCEFRACRGCLLGDLKKQKRRGPGDEGEEG